LNNIKASFYQKRFCIVISKYWLLCDMNLYGSLKFECESQCGVKWVELNWLRQFVNFEDFFCSLSRFLHRDLNVQNRHFLDLIFLTKIIWDQGLFPFWPQKKTFWLKTRLDYKIGFSTKLKEIFTTAGLNFINSFYARRSRKHKKILMT